MSHTSDTMRCLCFSGLFYSAYCSEDSFMFLQVASFLPFSLLDNSLSSQVGGDICIVITDSQHCCTVETNILWYSNYTPIKKWKNNNIPFKNAFPTPLSIYICLTSSHLWSDTILYIRLPIALYWKLNMCTHAHREMHTHMNSISCLYLFPLLSPPFDTTFNFLIILSFYARMYSIQGKDFLLFSLLLYLQ